MYHDFELTCYRPRLLGELPWSEENPSICAFCVLILVYNCFLIGNNTSNNNSIIVKSLLVTLGPQSIVGVFGPAINGTLHNTQKNSRNYGTRFFKLYLYFIRIMI